MTINTLTNKIDDLKEQRAAIRAEKERDPERAIFDELVEAQRELKEQQRAEAERAAVPIIKKQETKLKEIWGLLGDLQTAINEFSDLGDEVRAVGSKRARLLPPALSGLADSGKIAMMRYFPEIAGLAPSPSLKERRINETKAAIDRATKQIKDYQKTLATRPKNRDEIEDLIRVKQSHLEGQRARLAFLEGQ